MPRFTILLLLCLVFAGNPVRLVADTAAAKAMIAKQLLESRTPGAVAGVYRGDQTLLETAVGLASLEPSVPINLGQHFRIGSITKAFLGVIVLQLVDEGKLSLESKLADYVPNFPAAEQISIGDLGRMTARIKDPLYRRSFKSLAQSNPRKVWTAQEVIAATADTPRWPDDPSNKWNYSNTAAILLAQVVQQVSEDSFTDQLKTRILAPLQLKHTGYELSAELPEPHAKGYSLAPKGRYLSRGGTELRDVSDINPSLWNAAGAMHSTLDDLRIFARALGRGDLISRTSYSVQCEWQETPWDDHQYGFLLARIGNLVGHDGDVAGFSSFIGYRAADDLTIVVLANLHGWSAGTMPANEIAQQLADLF